MSLSLLSFALLLPRKSCLKIAVVDFGDVAALVTSRFGASVGKRSLGKPTWCCRTSSRSTRGPPLLFRERVGEKKRHLILHVPAFETAHPALRLRRSIFAARYAFFARSRPIRTWSRRTRTLASCSSAASRSQPMLSASRRCAEVCELENLTQIRKTSTQKSKNIEYVHTVTFSKL